MIVKKSKGQGQMSKQTVSYYLEKEHIDYIETQAQKNGGTTASAGLRFILDEHRKRAAIDAYRVKNDRQSTLIRVEKIVRDLDAEGKPLLVSTIRERMNERYVKEEDYLTDRHVVGFMRMLGYEILRDGEGRLFAEMPELETFIREI